MKIVRVFAILYLSVVVTEAGAGQQPISPSSKRTVGADSSGDSIVATVEGEEVTMRSLDAFAREQNPQTFSRLTQQLYDMREKALEDLTATRLMSNEAKRLGMSVDDMERSKCPTLDPTEAEIRASFEEGTRMQRASGRPVPSSIEDVRPLIVKYLRDQKRVASRSACAEKLRGAAALRNSQVKSYLAPPRQAFTLEPRDRRKGSGAIDVVLFADFQCEYCAKLEPVMKQLEADFDGQLTMVWKDYPLPNHQFAVGAAQAAWCANDQGKFQEYRELLFGNQSSLDVQTLLAHAKRLALDLDLFDKCVEDGPHQELIKSSQALGAKLGVGATPTVFVNGVLIQGLADIETYRRAIRREISLQRQ